jgi:ABC-type antimicrobial peptide transport system permease subunit
MFIAALIVIWLITFALLAFWTLGAWGVAALANIDWSSTQAIEAAVRDTAGPWLEGTPLQSWIPLLTDLIASLGNLLAGAGQWLPALTWTVWGIGSVIMVLLAVLASVLAAWLMRSRRRRGGQQPV